MTKKTLNQNAKYVHELMDLIEPDLIFSNKPINRLKTVGNNNDNTGKFEKLLELKKKKD